MALCEVWKEVAGKIVFQRFKHCNDLKKRRQFCLFKKKNPEFTNCFEYVLDRVSRPCGLFIMIVYIKCK